MAKVMLAVLLAAGAAGDRPAPECTVEDALEADEAVSGFAQAAKEGGWDKLQPLIRRYRHCDEGGVSAAFSQAVCKLFVQRWKDAADVARAGRKNAATLEFVLRHVDALCTEDELESIKRNADKKCPRYAKSFCAALVERVEAALDEQP